MFWGRNTSSVAGSDRSDGRNSNIERDSGPEGDERSRASHGALTDGPVPNRGGKLNWLVGWRFLSRP